MAKKKTTIKQDKRNYRLHPEENKNLIAKSLQELGAGRSIVIDNEDSIIAGNGVYEQAQKLGIPIEIIESDGSKLIVVKRIDLATDDLKRKELALADNSTSDSSVFDFEVLADDWGIDELADWGVEFPSEDEGDEVGDKIPLYSDLNQRDDDEWAGMPEFENKENYFKIVVNFEFENDRDEFADKHEIEFNMKRKSCWSTSYPFKENDDSMSVKYE